MTHAFTKPPKLHTVFIVLGLMLVVLLCAQLLPINATTGSSPKHHLSVSVDGDSMLPVVGTVVTAATQGPFLNPIATTTEALNILGAPGTGANNTVTLADCWAIPLNCAWNLFWDTGMALVQCANLSQALLENDQAGAVYSAQMCTQYGEAALNDLLQLFMWAVSSTMALVSTVIGQGMQVAAVKWAGWILNDELGGNDTSVNPLVSCKVAQGEQASNCGTSDKWFLGQYNMMRQVSLFLLLPLFMLLVMQSILRGSMYLLIRGFLVMLPTAILGTVMAVFFVQLLLDLSDDFVGMVGSYTQSTTQYATAFTSGVGSMDTSKVNWIAIFWMFGLLFATVIIYVELLLRQVGVYMAAFFLPLGFAGLVWPAAVVILKKLIELVIGFIFSKVFIAAAFALGIQAMANPGSATGVSSMPNSGLDDATAQGLSTLFSGTLIFCMAAFAGTKVIAITPAAMTAAEGRVMNPGSLWGRGQLVDYSLRRMNSRQANRNANRGRGRVAQQWFRLTGRGYRNSGPPR